MDEKSGKTIIFLDDEQGMRNIISFSLKKKGHNCIPFERGQDCIDYLKEHKDEVDVLILDYMMPGMNGLQVAKTIREELGMSELKIFMTTNKMLYAEDKEKIRESNIELLMKYHLLKEIEKIL